jgi:hypothetical protein
MSVVEERREPAKLSRNELYRLVWETPLIHLANRYGVTGKGGDLRPPIRYRPPQAR